MENEEIKNSENVKSEETVMVEKKESSEQTSNIEVPEKSEEKKTKKVRPKIFSKPDEDVKISVFGYYNKETGDFEFAVPDNGDGLNNEDEDESNNFIIQKHTFIFSRIPYNRLNIYRDRASTFKSADKVAMIDYLKFRDFIWTFHLKDWDLEDEDGKKIELTHDIDGTLSDESEKLLWQVPSMILDMVIQMYESKLNLL